MQPSTLFSLGFIAGLFFWSLALLLVLLVGFITGGGLRQRKYEVQLAPDLRALMDKPLRKEANLLRRRITRRFVQLGYRDLETDEAFIRFARVVVTVDRIYYKIDVRRLPDDLRLADLVSAPNLQEVSVAIEHTVQIHIAPLDGAWLVVCRRGYEEAPETYIPWLEDKKKRALDGQMPGAALTRQPTGGLVEEFVFDELPAVQRVEQA